MAFPFLWMFLTSVKSFPETVTVPVTVLPRTWRFENYREVFHKLPYVRLYANTLLFMFWRVVCAVLSGVTAGYVFGRIRFPGKGVLFFLILSQMMVPSEVYTIPQYLMLAGLGALNTIFALVFPGLISCFGVFLMRQFYMGVAGEFEEAAFMEGANDFQILTRIMFPIAKAPLTSLGVIAALGAYKNLMWPLIVNMHMEKMTLTSALATFQTAYFVNYPYLMTGAMLAVWPVLVLYLFFQKPLIRGVQLNSGIKL